MTHERGLWGMYCWNGLSAEQQRRLVIWGNLPFLYEPGGTCPNGAQVEIFTEWDQSPGPRFYCVTCAVEFLMSIAAELAAADS